MDWAVYTLSDKEKRAWGDGGGGGGHKGASVVLSNQLIPLFAGTHDNPIPRKCSISVHRLCQQALFAIYTCRVFR